MKFTHYTSAKAFLADNLSAIKRNEIQNNLLLKNIGDEPSKTMISVKDDEGNPLLIATRTDSFPLTMYEVDNIRNDNVVKFFAQSLAEHNIEVDLLLTEKELARSFCDNYPPLVGRTATKTESLVLYLIDKVADLPVIDGVFREATLSDLYYLPYWYADFAPSCGLGDYNLEGGIKGATNAVENHIIYIWEDKVPVSMAMNTRQVADCGFIGHVYTPPNLRGKSYSTACVASLTRRMLEDGFKSVALYADCNNPYSNAVYRKVGYKEIGWVDQYRIV